MNHVITVSNRFITDIGNVITTLNRFITEPKKQLSLYRQGV